MSLNISALLTPNLSDHNGVPQHHLRDLDTARQVQQKLFPRELPGAAGWTFAAHCRPARVVAGDYYDLFEVAPGRVAITLGDVSGKGLGPALVMAELHALVRSRLPQRMADLAGLTAELNDYLLAATLPDMFVSLFLAILDTPTGHLRYVNSGHPPPLLLEGISQGIVHLTEGGRLLGILPGERSETGMVELAPGSLLVLFSDGLTDAMNAKGERFREHRVLELLRAISSSPAPVILARLFEAVECFAGAAERVDDISLVVIGR